MSYCSGFRSDKSSSCDKSVSMRDFRVYQARMMTSSTMIVLECTQGKTSLVPRPPSRKGLATRMAMLRPRGIQSVTQSRVNVYTRGDNWSCVPLNSCMYSTKSSLNMSDTVPSRSTLLPRERRAAQYKSRITTGSKRY